MKTKLPNDDEDGSWDEHNCSVGRCEWCKKRQDDCECDCEDASLSRE